MFRLMSGELRKNCGRFSRLLTALYMKIRPDFIITFQQFNRTSPCILIHYDVEFKFCNICPMSHVINEINKIICAPVRIKVTEGRVLIDSSVRKMFILTSTVRIVISQEGCFILREKIRLSFLRTEY